MDRLQQVRLEIKAAELGRNSVPLRLFGAGAVLFIALAAAGMAVISLELFPAPVAGLILAVAAISGIPVFFLGRRHARRD